MNALKMTLAALALGVGSLFVGLGTADAQWGYRTYRSYSPYYGGYYTQPYRSYYSSPYGYRTYRSYTPYYGGGYYRSYPSYYGGSGIYLGRGGIGIRF